MINKKQIAFTLVELVVVITILAILGTVGFVGYSEYLGKVRDAVIQTDINEITHSLNKKIVSTGVVPIPNDYISIKSNGNILGYQGYFSEAIYENIGFDGKGMNQKLDLYHTYYVNKNKTAFQILGFLEGKEQAGIYKDFVYADDIDYSSLYTYIKGKKIGILTNKLNKPVQEITDLKTNLELDFSTTNANDVYKMFLTTDKYYTFSGSVLGIIAKTISNPGLYGAPDSCPDGFIPVAGDANFNQEGFCVAKYEMTYSEDDSPGAPNSSKNSGRNTYGYDDDNDGLLEEGEIGYNKKIASRNDYPITDISQELAQKACKTMGKDYHLITNNEWMTIARQIELNKDNWSGGDIGNGIIYNGVSSDTGLGCNETGGNTGESRANGTKTGPGSDDGCNIKRKHKLFNGQEIYDFSGNVREHVNGANKTNLDPSRIMDKQSCAQDEENRFSFYGSDGADDSISLCDYTNSYPIELYGPLFAINNNNGIGNIHSYNSSSNSNVLLRGGYAIKEDLTGIYTLYTNRGRTSEGSNVGFRCAKTVD